MEASALTRVSGRGLLARRSPLLRFESDERLVDLIRAGHDGAFEVLFTRYNSRLLGFCQSMVKSRQDAEDVLQEVFTNAHSAMLADERKINVRPWLYRIARNRCLNHLRKAVPEGQDSMDVLPHSNGITTAEHVQNREDLRQLMADVETLPETQRTALLLREIDQLAYEEIAQAMGTTVPSVKSLLVRARIGLAESGQARLLTCDEVQVTLAEAAEGIRKADGPTRKHVRDCEGCKSFRNQLRSDHKAMAALFPVGLLATLQHGLLAKLFGGGTAAGGSSAAVGGGAAAGGVGGAGAGILSGAIGAKAVAGFATAALLTAGAVEVRNIGKDNEAASSSPKPALAAAAPAAAQPEEAVHFPVSHPFEDRDSKREATPPPAAEPADRDAAPASEPAVPAAQDDASKPADPALAADEPVADDGSVAVGTPVDPGTTPTDGGQNPGSAPDEPVVPTTPVDPTVPTTPPPTGEPVEPAPPAAPAPGVPPTAIR